MGISVSKSRRNDQEFKLALLMREAEAMMIFQIQKEEEGEILRPQEKQTRRISVASLWMRREDPLRGKRPKGNISLKIHKDNLLRIFLVLLLTMMSLINMKKSLMFPKAMSMMKKMTRRESERRSGRRGQPRPSLTSLIPMTLLLVTTLILIKR